METLQDFIDKYRGYFTDVEYEDVLRAGTDKLADNNDALSQSLGNLEFALVNLLRQRIAKAVQQTSHGLSINDVIRWDGTKYALADWDSPTSAQAVGLVTRVDDSDNFVFTEAGYIEGVTDAALNSGTLTNHTVYYVGDSGKLASWEQLISRNDVGSDTHYEKPMFLHLSGGNGIVLLDRPASLVRSQLPMIALAFKADDTSYFTAPEPMSLKLTATKGTGTLNYHVLDAADDEKIETNYVQQTDPASLPISLDVGDTLRITISNIDTDSFRTLTFERVD